MHPKLLSLMAAFLLSLSATAATGCGEDDVRDAGNKAGEAAGKAAEETGDAAQDAGNAAEDATDEAD
jgi:hypothetical protein